MQHSISLYFGGTAYLGIPYNEEFTKAMTLGLTIVEHDKGALTAVLQDVWSQLQEICAE